MSPEKRKEFAAGALLVTCVGLLLLYPYETTVVPPWNIRVTDELGGPVAKAIVSEHWRHHSIETQGHDEARTTNDEGYVWFPRRTVRASLAFRIIGRAVVLLNVHGESGPKASAIVLGPYLTSRDSQYSPDKPSPEVIEIRPQP